MLFGVHLHQPVDNFDWVIEKAVNECYGPFFETLSKYPEFKFAFHSSGWIMEKIKNDYRDVFESIKKCNIEFFTGGYYEPVLVSIPSEDRIYQIQKLNNFLKENFNAAPSGLWLTERVWDDEIVSDLKRVGVEYVIVDDYHFYASGYKKINGYYLTGMFKKIALFPISKELRYAIPFKKVGVAINLLKNNLVMFDDIEKFGLWPETKKRVYKEKWLEEFVEKTIDKSMHFRDFYKNNKPIAYAFIENLSYEEMTEWVLDAEDIIKLKKEKQNCHFAKGSIWKRFFYKYKESNYLHKRMLESIKNESYYKLQTNDVYWHGIFGGLYLPNLRDNAYKYLIECDNGMDECKDIDFDGSKEIKKVFENSIFVFNSRGELIEFDNKIEKINYLNTIKRYKEFYHLQDIENKEKKEVKTIHEMDIKIDKKIYFDDYYRYSFVLRKKDEVNLDKLIKNETSYLELEYYVNFENDKIIFKNEKITKIFKLSDKKIEYEIKGEALLEFNFHFYDYDEIKEGEFEGDGFKFHDLRLKFDNTRYFVYLIKTYNLTEKGLQETIQGVSIVIENPGKGEICFE
ncbi:alpha-amylase/4-alpha-glucanotransferase domain-containing protein [Lebetimonas natsushimae]|nr:alpha-amylase/4-alpha-glucanotransferase domain-containing protein [Lebetimonas natsushimae]